MRAGLPPTMTRSGTSRVTSAPAITTTSSPMVHFGITALFMPKKPFDPTTTQPPKFTPAVTCV